MLASISFSVPVLTAIVLQLQNSFFQVNKLRTLIISSHLLNIFKRLILSITEIKVNNSLQIY